MLKKIFLTCILITSGVASKAQQIRKDTTETRSSYHPLSLVNNLLGFAHDHLHFRYRSGGSSTSGFDCSGFVRYCFRNFGMMLPHGSAAQSLIGDEIAKAEALPGDLIFFKGHNSGSSRIGHVGIITEVGDTYIKFIHSAWNGGVRYDYLESDYYRRRFISIKRVVGLLDMVPQRKARSSKK